MLRPQVINAGSILGYSAFFAAGLFCSTLYGIYVTGSLDASDGFLPSNGILAWSRANLGMSVWLFLILVIAYLTQWRRTQSAINRSDVSSAWSAAGVLDTLSSSAFGVGVIWTAIGMRDALQSTFSGLDATSVAGLSALDVLSRLVEGGIILALSTTVFGGILGYSMQAAKSIWLAPALGLIQDTEREQAMQRLDGRLVAIERALSTNDHVD